MFKKAMAISVALLAGASLMQTAGAQAPKPHAFSIQDNSFTYSFGAWYRDPYNFNDAIRDSVTHAVTTPAKARNISKHGIQFTHIDIGNKLGDNTFVMSYWSSNHANPVGSFHGNSAVGAKDIYVVYRHNFSLSRLFPKKSFKLGPISDVIVVAGADFNSKNDDFSAQRRSPMVGPGVAFKVPNKGFANLAALWTKEWNEEGTSIQSVACGTTVYTVANLSSVPATCYTPYAGGTGFRNVSWGKAIEYNATYSLQANWGVPFALGKAPMQFTGMAVFNGGKGYSNPAFSNKGTTVAYGTKGTKPETIIRPVLNYNIGSLVGPTHNWQLGVGYQYWNNKYGNDHHLSTASGGGVDVSAVENAPFIQFVIHL